MIIVKTKNGDHFINEKAVTEVTHDREKATVSCYGANGYFSHHEDVEGVVYTNDAQPTSWTDEGSEIKRLAKALEEHKEWSSKLRAEHLDLMQERDQLKQECEELKARVAELTPKEEPDEIGEDDYETWKVLREEISHWRHMGYKSDSVAWALRTGNHVSLEVAHRLSHLYGSIDANRIKQALIDGDIQGVVPEMRTQKVTHWNRYTQQHEEKTREQPVGHYEFNTGSLILWLEANYTRRTSGSSMIDKYLAKIIANANL